MTKLFQPLASSIAFIVCFLMIGISPLGAINITISEDLQSLIESNESNELETEEANQENDFVVEPQVEGSIPSEQVDQIEQETFVQQNQLGLIKGQVFDKDTGETLQGVVVLIQGTDFGTITNEEGLFSFSDVTDGIYTLSFFKDGYIEAKVTETAVVAGEETVLNFAMPPRPVEMSDDIYELQDFVVTASEANEFVMNLELVMSSQSTLSIMSSEDFSKFAASDIGDAVKRVSGVSVEGGKYASIRGLSDRYVSTTLNGLPIASPDPDRLAVQLDLFPTSFFSSLEVFKTYSSERISNATGAINLITKPIPESAFFNVSVGTNFNSNVKDGEFLLNNRTTQGDRWANGAKDRALTFSAEDIPQTSEIWEYDEGLYNTLLNQYLLNGSNEWITDFILPSEFEVAVQELERFKDALGRANHNYFGTSPKYGNSMKIDFGDSFYIGEQSKLGFVGGYNYSRSFKHIEADFFRSTTELSGSYTLSPEHFLSPLYSKTYHKAIRTNSTIESSRSVSFGVGLEINDQNKINFSYLDLNTSTDSNTRIDASNPGYGKRLSSQHGSFRTADEDPDDGIWDEPDPYLGTFDDLLLDYQINESLHYTERNLTSYQLSGTNSYEFKNFLDFDSIDLYWAAGQDETSQVEPGFTQTRGVVISNEKDFTLWTNSTSKTSVNPSFIIFRDIQELKDNGRFDFTLKRAIDQKWETAIGFGALRSESTRVLEDQYLNMFGVVIDGTETENATVPSSNNEGAPMANYDDLTPTSLVQAAYVDLETLSDGKYFSMDQTLFDNFRLVYGLRYEKNSAHVKAIDEDGNGNIFDLRGAGTENPLADVDPEGGYDYRKWLPSISFIWSGLNDAITVRTSYSDTVAFPSAREISPYATSAFSGSDINVGNANLKPSEVENFDIGLTARNAQNDSFTLNIFKKNISNRIERINGLGADSSTDLFYEGGNYDYLGFSQNLGASVFSWYNNPGKGKLKGFEIEGRKDLSSLGLNDFSFGFNFTKIEGEIDRMPIEIALKTADGIEVISDDQLEAYRKRALIEQPEHLANFDFSYSNSSFDLEVSLIGFFISDVLKGTSLADSYDFYDKSYRSFDLVISKGFGERSKLKFVAKNLNNPRIDTVYRLFDDQMNEFDVIRDSYQKGRSFSISYSYEF